jgi:hypothetical protein
MFNDALIASGGTFGDDFDPDLVQFDTWGDFWMTFSDVNSGVAGWDSEIEGWGAGELTFERVTSIAGINKTTPVNGALSGSWYDPSHNGEGWLVEILSENAALIYWFTYDGQGNQVWLFGVATIDGKTMTADMLITGGPVFGPDYDPADFSTIPWGTLVFTVEGCDEATASYVSLFDEFGSGALEPKRVTSLAGLGCE